MNLHEIVEIPQNTFKVNQSATRSHHILKFVLEMVERGDSKETILQVAEYLSSVKDKPRAETAEPS